MLLNCKKNYTLLQPITRLTGPERYDFYLQPLDRIHLYSMQDYGTAETQCRGYHALLYAAIHWATRAIDRLYQLHQSNNRARSASRLREVGLRKVSGRNTVAINGSIFGRVHAHRLISRRAGSIIRL